MSDTLKLGNLVSPENYNKRDATHIAVAAVEAGENLAPGTHVGFLADGRVGKRGKNIGIVDPFLKRNVIRGDKFWLYLYPGSITSLQHLWTHPAFNSNTKVDEEIRAMHPSEKWIRDYAEQIGVEYQELMDNANSYIKWGNYWCEGGRFESMRIPDEFWIHYEKLTGEKGEGSFFSCSC